MPKVVFNMLRSGGRLVMGMMYFFDLEKEAEILKVTLDCFMNVVDYRQSGESMEEALKRCAEMEYLSAVSKLTLMLEEGFRIITVLGIICAEKPRRD